MATELGKSLAQTAMGKGIQSVVFDRSGNLYHGRIKAVADGAREAGLKF
jgi:large subunit ribosomal protein L18